MKFYGNGEEYFKLMELKNSIEKLMAEIGYKGEIDSRHPLVDDVMNKLHDLDPK